MAGRLYRRAGLAIINYSYSQRIAQHAWSGLFLLQEAKNGDFENVLVRNRTLWAGG